MSLVGVKYCGMDVEWCLNILQDMVPQEELIVNKAIAWTLRDLSKKHHNKIKMFIEEYKCSQKVYYSFLLFLCWLIRIMI
ncbi:MAG: DNA alkylation repair protein [bacterium]